MIDILITNEYELHKNEQFAEEGIWVTNGQQIKIKDMTTEHIKKLYKLY